MRPDSRCGRPTSLLEVSVVVNGYFDNLPDIDLWLTASILSLPLSPFLCSRLLHSDDLHLLTRSIGLLDHLTKSSSDVQDEVRLLGGIPLLLNILR